MACAVAAAVVPEDKIQSEILFKVSLWDQHGFRRRKEVKMFLELLDVWGQTV